MSKPALKKQASLTVGSLKSALEKIKPGLSNKEYVPMFSCFCFEKTGVTAYSDVLGASIDLDTGIEGAIKADALLTWLSALVDGSVQVVPGEGKVKFSSGGSTLTTPLIPPSEFLHEVPEDWENMHEVTITESIVDGLTACLETVGDEAAGPVFSCIAFDLFAATLYSTNGIAMSKYMVEMSEKETLDQTQLLPQAFCRALLGFFGGPTTPAAKLYVSPNLVMAWIEDAKALVFSKVPDAEAMDYESELASCLTTDDDENFIPVDPQFMSALKRASAVCGEDKTASFSLEIKGKSVTLKGEGTVSALEQFDLTTPHKGDRKVFVNARALCSVLPLGAEFQVAEKVTAVRVVDKLLCLQAHLNV